MTGPIHRNLTHCPLSFGHPSEDNITMTLIILNLSKGFANGALKVALNCDKMITKALHGLDRNDATSQLIIGNFKRLKWWGKSLG